MTYNRYTPVLALLLAPWICAPSDAQQAPKAKDEDASGIYGTREDYVRNKLPAAYRPAENWRSYLAPWLAGDNVHYSQGFEELVIRDFFRDMKGGVFLDVGCWRPTRSSTTCLLERHLGWTGIAIDAVADYADDWKKRRPRSRFFSYAITDTDGDTLSFYVRHAMSSLDKEHVEKVAKTFSKGVERPPPVEITVSTITLNTLLDQAGVERIDFLSMDIEGAEPAALRGFDIQRFRPALVCIERSDDKFFDEYFTSNGYELIEKYRPVDKVNCYYRPTADIDLFR